MLKPVPSLIAALAAALVVVSTAAAITGGGVDGNAHPYVGALVADGSVQCSGVLVAPRVFATAGHCAADGARVFVSFDSKLGEGWDARARHRERGSLQGRRPCRRRARRSRRLRARDSARGRLGRVARQGSARDERRLRILEHRGRRELRLRRPPPRRKLAGDEGVEGHAGALHECRWPVPGRLRRPAARREHRALDHLGRLRRTAPARQRATASTRRPRARSSATSSRCRNSRAGSIVQAVHGDCC